MAAAERAIVRDDNLARWDTICDVLVQAVPDTPVKNATILNAL